MFGADIVSQRKKLLRVFDKRVVHVLASAFARWRDHCHVRVEPSLGIKLPLLKTVRARQRTPIGQPSRSRAPISSAPDRLGTNERSDPFAAFAPKNSVDEVMPKARQSHSASGRSRGVEQA